ncbi:MAG: ABC transporter permease [Phycisphaerales bacterium]|nr:ABC transporter permease [Phycisphaerales bacterium]
MSARPSRSALLVAVVALCATLITAIAFALASVQGAIGSRLDSTFGRADLRITSRSGGGDFDASLAGRVANWPEVDRSSARFTTSLSLRSVRYEWTESKDPTRNGYVRQRRVIGQTPMAQGVDIDAESRVRPMELVEGRWPTGPGEIVIDQASQVAFGKTPEPGAASVMASLPGLLSMVEEDKNAGPEFVESKDEAERLTRERMVRLGSVLEFVRPLREPVKLTVVGISASPIAFGRPEVFLQREALAELAGKKDRLTQIDIVVRDGVDATGLAEEAKSRVPGGLLVQTTAKITSGLSKNMQANQLGFALASIMAFLAASFIVTTGITTGVTEKQRDLAVIRCIGGTRAQLAWSQVFVGIIIGAAGAIIGVPLGVLAAWVLVTLFRDVLPSGFAFSWTGVLLSPFGCLLAGVVGSAYPAWQASRVSPLEALAQRAAPASRAWIIALSLVGLLGVVAQLIIVTQVPDGQVMFWSYASVGLPAMYCGYFVLGVPLVLLASWALGPVIAKIMRLPPRLLERSVARTPFRHGFTAGAMMTGLGLMTALWTQGSSVMRDWLGKLEFPDAFVVGLNLTPKTQQEIQELPFVSGTCAIALQNVETDAFGVRALQKYTSTFIAFEPDSFFNMTQLSWVQGDEATARVELNKGGAILVAREFHAAQKLGVGDVFKCRHDGKDFEFRIVGVVTSPGLDVVNKFFNVGEEYTDQSVHAVFGSRRDLREKFGSDAINMIQIGLKPIGEPGAVDDQEAVKRIRAAAFEAGVLDAGSGRWIKEEIRTFVRGSLLVSSVIAIFAMGIAGLGVANLIIAGIATRQFEFGVLRAVGATRGQIARLVLSEAIIIAIAACVLGTAIGFQGALAGRRLNYVLFGLELTFQTPWGPIAWGWLAVGVMTLGAAAPAVLALARRRPRELLGAMKG